MKHNFMSTFDYSGRVLVETPEYTYIYLMDGAMVRQTERMCRYKPGLVWSMCEQHSREVIKEKTMGKRQKRQDQKVLNKRLIAINALVKYMEEHGHFSPVRSGKNTYRGFAAVCDCPGNRISGILFYKWVHGPVKGIFNRLKVVSVCYKCKKKGSEEVFDEPAYKGSVLRRMFNLNWKSLPKPVFEKPKRKTGKAGLLQSTMPRIRTFKSLGLKR